MTIVFTALRGRGLRLFATPSDSNVCPHLAYVPTRAAPKRGFSLRAARQTGRGKLSAVRASTSSDVVTDVPKLRRPSEDELERIKAFRPPVIDFVPPYPYKKNKFAEKAKAEAHRWTAEYFFPTTSPTPEKVHYIYKLNLSEYAMATYVDCGEKEAAWTTKFFIWFTFFDDRLDHFATTSSPEKSTALVLELNLTLMWSLPDDERIYKLFVDSLDMGEVSERSQILTYVQATLDEARLKPGTVYDTSAPHFHALNKAFRDLWAELCEVMPADFLRRWALIFQKQILSNLAEIRNRKYNIHLLSVDDYILSRRGNFGFPAALVAVEFADNVHLPDMVFDCSEMKLFINAASDFLSIHNDLWSFYKEAIQGDVNNLVIIVSRVEDCSYGEAGAKLYQMMLDNIIAMEKAIIDLQHVSPTEYQYAISRYIHFARCSITGAHHWSVSSGRYFQST